MSKNFNFAVLKYEYPVLFKNETVRFQEFRMVLLNFYFMLFQKVPVPISDRRATFLSMNWLIDQGKSEPRTTRFYVKLANEIINASKFEVSAQNILLINNFLHYYITWSFPFSH